MRRNHRYSTVTSKGQVTIPMIARKELQLVTGSKIEFILQDGCMIVMPINNSLSKLRGILPKPPKPTSINEMDEVIRSRYDRG